MSQLPLIYFIFIFSFSMFFICYLISFILFRKEKHYDYRNIFTVFLLFSCAMIEYRTNILTKNPVAIAMVNILGITEQASEKK